MISTPTILIGVSKKKINRLIYSKNEIYYYVINEQVRKVISTLFDALGNISSRNDYYCFIKKHIQFKPFSSCRSANLLKFPLLKDQAMLIAIDLVTRELYLPTQTEFDSISLYVNYPIVIPQVHDDLIKKILEEHSIQQFKKQYNNVIMELLNNFYEIQYFKHQFGFVLDELIDNAFMKPIDFSEEHFSEEIYIQHEKEYYINHFNLVLHELRNHFYTKFVEDDYEEELQFDFSKDEYQYSALDCEPSVEYIDDEINNSLEFLVHELKEVMTLANTRLPQSKTPDTSKITYFLLKDEADKLLQSIKEETEEIQNQPVIELLSEKEQLFSSGEYSFHFEEEEPIAILEEPSSTEEIILPNSNPVSYPLEIIIDDTDSASDSKDEASHLEKSLPSTVEFIEVKEVQAEAEEEAEVSVPNVFLAEAIQEVINATEEKIESIEKVLEKELTLTSEESLEDGIEEISKEEFEPEKDQMKSSNLVSELFQKYENDTRQEEVKKPEPQKSSSYLGSMLSYFGWRR